MSEILLAKASRFSAGRVTCVAGCPFFANSVKIACALMPQIILYVSRFVLSKVFIVLPLKLNVAPLYAK